MIGVASTAPGYSLAASLGLMTGSSGAQAPAILLVAFVPMLFIAAAYYYLNRADPDCGTTFTWVHARHRARRRAGSVAGAIIVADLLVMPSLAAITGSYFFLLFGWDGPANNKWWVLLVGVIFIFLMTLICVIGIELNARTQFFLLAAELIVLVVVRRRRALQGAGRRPSRVGRSVVVVAQPVRPEGHLGAGRRHGRRHLPLLGLGHRGHGQRGDQGLPAHARAGRR